MHRQPGACQGEGLALPREATGDQGRLPDHELPSAAAIGESEAEAAAVRCVNASIFSIASVNIQECTESHLALLSVFFGE